MSPNTWLKKLVLLSPVCVGLVCVSVVADLIDELHANVTVARLKGQPVYLYPPTCNLPLTGLTKTLTADCCHTQTH